MEKPMSMSIKQWLIRRMALSTMIPEKTLEAVINHQFNSMIDSMSSCDTLEVSGFGKFSFNTKKAQKLLIKYEGFRKCYLEQMEEELTEQKRHTLELKLATIEREIKILKTKLNEA